MIRSPVRQATNPKLILLGGATRSGKGIISRELGGRTGFPLLSLDVLKMGLHRTVPSMGVDPNAHSREVGRSMWPLVRAMASNVLQAEMEYVFEGDMLLPSHAAELTELAGSAVRSCFVGYREIDPLAKLAEVRKHRGHPNDWLNDHTDAEVLEVIRDAIEYSAYLAEECDRFGLRYFDESEDFRGTLDAVVSYLLE